MIQSSGFFGPAAPLNETDSAAPEPLYESVDGHCILLKGHRNDRLVVYKSLKPEFREDPVQQRMLRREYEIGASLKHPGICEVLSWIRLSGYGDSIEMEWIDGSRLDEWLDSHPDASRRRKVLLDLCDSLAYLHRKQVIHKDLKPENILVTRHGDYVKILDFGLSDTDSILTGKDPAGTWQYAAPEVIRGETADVRSDIFSLGRIMQDMGPAFSRIARKCTEEDISKRYDSAEAVRRDLETLKPSRHRLTISLLIFLLLLAAVVLLFLLKRGDPVEKLFLDAAEQVRNASTGLR